MWHKEMVVIWEALPTHPTVMSHPTAEHKKIRFLHPHNGVMLIGYGDWNENLGPVDVIGYSLTTGLPVTLHTNVMTEAWDRIRILDGHAYLPWTDPKTYAGNQGGFTTDRTGAWTDVKVGPGDSMLHTFDIAKIGGKIHVCGSRDARSIGEDYPPGTIGYGTVWREDAPGVWVESLRGVSRDAFARFHSFKAVGDKWRIQNTAGGVETYETVDGSSWYPVTDTAWTSTPYWGANSADPPAALPTGYTNHGVGPVSAVAYHEGWVWVGGTDGRVKRALVPDAVETPVPGATAATNLAPRPRTQAFSSNNGAQFTVTAAQTITGSPHPLGLATGVKVAPTPELVGVSAYFASVYNVDGLGAATTPRHLGVWVKASVPATFTIYLAGNQAATIRHFTAPVADTWTWVHTSTAGAGNSILAAHRVSGNTVAGDHAFIQGVIASPESAEVFFDGDTPKDYVYRYQWTGAPGNSTSQRIPRGI